MTSAFADAFADGLDSMYEGFGEAVVYTNRDGWQHDITVIIDRNLDQYGDTIDVQGMTAVISVRLSDVSEPPRKNEIFRLGSDTCSAFTVAQRLESDEFEHRVLVS